MELNGYRLLLPEGTLDYFDLVDVKESVNEVVIYLEEKNIVPEKYTDQDIESKGFYDPVIVHHHNPVLQMQHIETIIQSSNGLMMSQSQ